MIRPWFLLSCALPLVACGGTTFGGLGADDDDDGGGSFIDTGLADAIFPADDASGKDTSTGDTKASSDSGSLTDSIATDTKGDGVALDTSALDTSILDTSIEAGVDSGAPDTGTLDTGALDTASSDTGVDTAPLDSGSDAPIVSFTDVVGKVGCYDTGASPAHALQCDKYCCGNLDFLFAWQWKCGTDCGIGGRTYACDQSADCDAGKVCCTGTSLVGTINGSSCQASCGSDKQLCATSAECGGKTCTAFTPPDAKYTVGACE